MASYNDPHYGTGSRSVAEFRALQARNAAALALAQAEEARPEPIEDVILAALAPVNPDTGDDDARFSITDKGGADWVARLVAKARREYDADVALFASEMEPIEQEIDRLQSWLDGRLKAKEAVEAQWLPLLKEWHASQREVVTHRKTGKETVVNASIALPSGATLVSKRKPPSATVSDLEALYAFVTDNLPAEVAAKVVTVIPEHVVPEERKPNLAGIKVVFEARADDGEQGPFVLGSTTVPGIYAERGDIEFKLETPKADQ